MAAVSTVAAAQSVCPARDVWPSPEWAEALVAPNADTSALDDYAFPPGRDEASRRGVRTDGLLIIKAGRIIYERYGRGFSRTNRHPGRSVTKNFSSALVGVAVREGLVALDDSVCTHLPEFNGRPQCAIRVIDTITHGSGLAWQEVGFDGVESSLWAMLHGEGHRDLVSFVLGHAMATEPGTRWAYNTGTASLAAAIAQRVLAPKYGRDALWKALFEAGVYVNVALHPAVPPGGALLRTSVMATHNQTMLDEALTAFEQVKRSFEAEHGPLPSPAA